MLLLRGPSTRPNDVAISLTAPAGCHATAAAMAAVAVATRCPPHVAERVRACILHSGRYDCRVSAAAAFALARDGRLGRIGARVVLVELDG